MSLPASVIALANAEYGWRAEALCRDTDPELFFPIGTTGAALVQIEQARAVCRQCPVQAACLAPARRRPDPPASVRRAGPLSLAWWPGYDLCDLVTIVTDR